MTQDFILSFDIFSNLSLLICKLSEDLGTQNKSQHEQVKQKDAAKEKVP